MSEAIQNAIKATLAWAARRGMTEGEFDDLRLAVADMPAVYVYRRRNDSATGAINTGHGPTEPEQVQLLGVGADAPMAPVLAAIEPPVADPVRVGNEVIYREWWEYSRTPDGPWTREAPTTEVSQDLRDWLVLSYRVGVNPLPALRKLGYTAEYMRDWVELSRGGARPVRINI